MNETIGNLSQTIVKLPNFFKSSVFNAPTRGSPYNYKKPPVMDTFNQVKKLNIPLRNRIFRLNDFLIIIVDIYLLTQLELTKILIL